MPVDINTSATFGDLILRLAVRTGNALQTGSVAALPTDEDVLARLKQCVNDGYERFLRSNTEWDWTFLTHPFTLTLSSAGTGPYNIDGDPARYRLPNYIAGTPRGDWRYVDTRTRRQFIKNVHPSIIDGRRQVSLVGTGAPSEAGCRALRTGDAVGQAPGGWEVIFWANPDLDYIVRADFRIRSHKMVDLSERHVAGGEHDAAIHAYAAAVWYEDDAEDPGIAERYRLAAEGGPGVVGELQKSKAIDLRNHDDSVGDNTGYPAVVGHRVVTRVYAHNGVPIPYD